MANDNNLIKNESLTPSERRENARRAGIASGIARSERKQFREILTNIFALDVSSFTSDEELLSEIYEINPEYINKVDLKTVMMIRLAHSALNGDLKAIEMVINQVDEKPSLKVSMQHVNVNLTASYNEVERLMEEQKRMALAKLTMDEA